MVEHEAPAKPLLTIGRGWAVYIGPVEPGRMHRHQAAQLAWSPQGALSVEGEWGMLETCGHFLPAGVTHRLVAVHPVRIVFLDPAVFGIARLHSRSASVVALTELQASLLEDGLDRWLQGQVSPVIGEAPDGTQDDPRWRTVLDWLEQALESPVHVDDAANAVGLSASRFMHWFAEVAGLPFRAYVRWLRLQRAVRTLSGGSTLTEAAHLAGFADSAHLTRTFVATFGVRPAPLRGARILCSDQARPPVNPDGLAFIDPA